jgi:hypothetical protein
VSYFELSSAKLLLHAGNEAFALGWLATGHTRGTRVRIVPREETRNSWTHDRGSYDPVQSIRARTIVEPTAGYKQLPHHL